MKVYRYEEIMIMHQGKYINKVYHYNIMIFTYDDLILNNNGRQDWYDKDDNITDSET